MDVMVYTRIPRTRGWDRRVVENLDDADPVAKHTATFIDGIYSVSFLCGCSYLDNTG